LVKRWKSCTIGFKGSSTKYQYGCIGSTLNITVRIILKLAIKALFWITSYGLMLRYLVCI
jgi:hypothetical protein